MHSGVHEGRMQKTVVMSHDKGKYLSMHKYNNYTIDGVNVY